MRRVVAANWLLVLCSLGGCPTVDTGETPVEPPPCKPNFQQFKEPGGIWDVAINPPDMTKSCVANDGCHSQATGRSALRLINKPSAEMTDSDWLLNYQVISRYLNCSEPSASQLITKPSIESDPHVGGDLWTCQGVGCQPETTIETWIESR